MIEELKKIIPKLKGKILIIGFDYDKLNQAINKNNNITYCDFLNSVSNNKEKATSGLTLNIRKLKKKYKKKKLDYILVNMDEVNKYINYFIKDSIYICQKKIYVFNNTNPDLIKNYKRYEVSINNDLKNDNLIEIDTTNAFNKILMDKVYFISDTLLNLLNKISDFLVS
ncbi:MAG: hypothetical protein PHW32_02745 [Bacilli bacterium]|nr:hypothetical protein [Bacilli bacterium]MDD4282741.1 hypothetical protein [Bacilli bacterium]